MLNSGNLIYLAIMCLSGKGLLRVEKIRMS